MSLIANARISDTVAVVGTGIGTGTVIVTEFHPVGRQRKFAAIFTFGVVDDTATIDCGIYKAISSNGSGSVLVKAATQIAADATANDNKTVIINVDESDLNDPTHPYVGAVLVYSAASLGAVVLLAADSKFGALTEIDLPSVVQVVN